IKFTDYQIQILAENGRTKIEYVNGVPIQELLTLHKSEISIEIIRNNFRNTTFSSKNSHFQISALKRVKKNQFIQYLISCLTEKDEVYPIEELNNGKLEYSLIFIYHRSQSTIIIENENENRSAYILQLVNYDSTIIEKLHYFFSSNTANKRRYLML